MSELVQLLIVSALTMGISHTVARERIFEPLRNRLGGKDTWLGYLVSCPYCASHWLAFLLVPLTATYPVRVAVDVPVLTPVLDWFLSSILVTVVAAFLRVGFYFIDETQGLVRRRQKRTDEEIADWEETHHPHGEGDGGGNGQGVSREAPPAHG